MNAGVKGEAEAREEAKAKAKVIVKAEAEAKADVETEAEEVFDVEEKAEAEVAAGVLLLVRWGSRAGERGSLLLVSEHRDNTLMSTEIIL